jgi:hypothetical protein
MFRLASLVLFSCVLFMMAGPVRAQTVNAATGLYNPDTRPLDINSVPVLATLVKNGAKLFYMGERSGLYGWFIIKDNQIQMIYVTADKQTAIIGGMFTGEGDNVTGPQIETLANTNKEVNDLINNAGKQQEDISKAGVPGGFAAVPGGTPSEAGQPLANKLPSVSLSPGERLLQDLQAAAGVTLGKNDQAELLVVMSPSCPHCKSTWKELRKPVEEGKVQVRLIPVIKDELKGNKDIAKNEDVRAGAQLLKAANPLEAWNKYAEGDTSALAGEAEGLQVQAILSNSMLMDRWNIKSIPYMVYRAKDGRVKIVQGEPQRMAAILNDLLK